MSGREIPGRLLGRTHSSYSLQAINLFRAAAKAIARGRTSRGDSVWKAPIGQFQSTGSVLNNKGKFFDSVGA
jgi:hypothetical protein